MNRVTETLKYGITLCTIHLILIDETVRAAWGTAEGGCKKASNRRRKERAGEFSTDELSTAFKLPLFFQFFAFSFYYH